VKICIDFQGLQADFVLATNRRMTDSLILGGRSTRASRRFRPLNSVQDENSMTGAPAVVLWFGLTEGQARNFKKSENVVPRCVCEVDSFLLSKT
jgi:hypothetical protein